MATKIPSSAPMFTTSIEAERTEDTGIDPITMHPGANQLLPAGTHSFIPVTEHSNRVQAGQLPHTYTEAGRANRAEPAGAQR